MQANSRVINSNQDNIHPDLKQLVLKHQATDFLQPFKSFSEQVFNDVDKIYQYNNTSIILDSGCGNGTSSINLAQKYPDCLIIGIDKSEFRLQHRLQHNSYYYRDNLIFVRADLIDFWRLAHQANWQLKKHYLLYPNPWPKKKHIQRRWHGHAVFPSVIKLGGTLECRSNWFIYIKELSFALKVLTYESAITELDVTDHLSPFEKKYHMSGHSLYQLKASL